jgi:type IV secretion system protein VirB2
MGKTLNRLAASVVVKAHMTDKHQAGKFIAVLVAALAVSVLLYDPAMAQTLESIDKAATKFDTFIGGTFAKTVAGIALAGTGFAALFNRLSWFWFGAVMLGTAIIFGRKQIIDIFAGT